MEFARYLPAPRETSEELREQFRSRVPGGGDDD
jgi:hypothetical protein